MVYSHKNFNTYESAQDKTSVIASSEIFFSLFSNFGKFLHFRGKQYYIFQKTFLKNGKNPKLFRNQKSGIMVKYSPLVIYANGFLMNL